MLLWAMGCECGFKRSRAPCHPALFPQLFPSSRATCWAYCSTSDIKQFAPMHTRRPDRGDFFRSPTIHQRERAVPFITSLQCHRWADTEVGSSGEKKQKKNKHGDSAPTPNLFIFFKWVRACDQNISSRSPLLFTPPTPSMNAGLGEQTSYKVINYCNWICWEKLLNFMNSFFRRSARKKIKKIKGGRGGALTEKERIWDLRRSRLARAGLPWMRLAVEQRLSAVSFFLRGGVGG